MMNTPSLAERPQFKVYVSVVVADSAGRILLVQEAKAICRELWNLPGGHLDHGERPVVGAAREVREETFLDLPMRALLGIYPKHESMRFVFLADNNGQTAAAGDEILAVRWLSPEEILASPDGELVAPPQLKQIAREFAAKQEFDLAMIRPEMR